MVLSVTTEHTALQKKTWTDNRLGQLGPAFQVLDLENGLVAKAAGGGAPREGAGGHMAWAGVQGGTHVGNAARGGGTVPSVSSPRNGNGRKPRSGASHCDIRICEVLVKKKPFKCRKMQLLCNITSLARIS